MTRRLTRPQRRAVTLAGLLLDLASALVLAVLVLAGVIPPGHAIFPAATLTLGIACGTAYMYRSRPRVPVQPAALQANRCRYGSCHHNHEQGSRS